MKVLRAFVLLALVYVPVLLPQFAMLLAVPLLLAAAASWTLYVAQPDFSKQDAKRHEDCGSGRAILIAGLLAHVLPVLEWRLRGFPGSYGALGIEQYIGIAVVIFGLAFRMYSIRLLGRFFTSTVEIQEQHALITAGPYKRVRHPSYLGSLVVIAGHALLLGAPVSAVVVTAMMLLAYQKRIRVEESALSAVFGKRYETYCSSTQRLIPFVW